MLTMARSCTVCGHDERGAIEAALMGETPLRTIADQYGLSKTALIRHRASHLPETLLRAQAAADDAQALDVMSELRRCLERVNLMYDACDRWLRDPDDATRYDVGPRADDVKVTYSTLGEDGRRRQRKERLSALLERIEASERGETARRVEWSEVKHADPRDLFLKTAARLEGHLTLLAKLVGDLDQEGTVNIIISPEWVAMRGVMLDALRPYPDARIALSERLAVIGANGHARN